MFLGFFFLAFSMNWGEDDFRSMMFVKVRL